METIRNVVVVVVEGNNRNVVVVVVVVVEGKYIEDITRWREDMNFIFEWQNNILRTSAASE